MKRAWRVFLAGLALLTLIAFCLVILLTPWGLRRLTPLLESRLSDLLSLEVTIEDPVLSWPLTMSLESITATDGEGQVRMDIRDAGIRISLRQLLKGRARVHRISIEYIQYSGFFPAPPEEEETDSEWELPLQVPDLEMLFEKVIVHDLQLNRVRLEPPLVQEPIELSLQGSFTDRILHAELELLEIADHAYSPTPRLTISLEVSPYNRFQNRDMVIAARVDSFAKLLPEWPESLEDELELLLDLRETRETTLRISKGHLLNPVGDLTFSGELDLTTARLNSSLDLFLPDLTRLQAWIPVDLSGAIRLQANLEGQLNDLSLDLRLAGEDRLLVAGMELEFQNRLSLSMDGQQFRLEPWELRLGKGRLRVAGEFTEDRLDFTAEILEFPLSGLGVTTGLDPSAELTAEIRLTGHPAQPEAGLSLDVRGLRPEDPDAWDGPPARFRFEAALADQLVKAQVRLEDLPGDPITLDVEIPLDLSLVPYRLTWPPEGEVEAHLQSNTDLAGLSRLFVLDVYHNLSGMLKVDVRVTGALKDPQVHGSIEMESGSYEHEWTGTLLQDISFGVKAERDFLSLAHFEATDGSGGTVSASGRVDFKPAERYPFAAKVNLKNFRFMQNDQVEAGGEGRLDLSGTLEESRLTGRILLAPLKVNLPEHLPPRMYELEVVEVFAENDVRRETEAEAEESSTPRRHRMVYDFRIEAPARVFVRGLGLDSEWSARIMVRGEGAEPLISGDVTLLRGRFMFFGRRLQLNRGVVTFDGSSPPSPILDVEAQIRSGGITGYLRVGGLAEDPELELASSPPLPEDEILARMLFARESLRITPWQALTLADAVNRLRGGGSTFDLMGGTRRILRVDQIDIRTPEAEEEGTTVAVGKYLSDRVYVEYEQGAGAESGRASVEVDLSPSIRLETTTGGDSDTGIGVRWTRDY